jgi:hypothetical protein
MKQTAVEWLIGELKKYDSAGLKDQSNYVIEMPTHILTELEEQAKEMEKQQQDKNKYSEEELKSTFKIGFNIGYGSTVQELDLKNEHCDKWFEQLKKK